MGHWGLDGFDSATGELAVHYSLPGTTSDALIAEFVGLYPNLRGAEWALPSRLVKEFAREFKLDLDERMEYFVGYRDNSVD